MNRFHLFFSGSASPTFPKSTRLPNDSTSCHLTGKVGGFEGWQIQVENWIWLNFESTLPIRFSNFCCSLQQPDSLEISLKIRKRLDVCSKSLNLRILQMDQCKSQILFELVNVGHLASLEIVHP